MPLQDSGSCSPAYVVAFVALKGTDKAMTHARGWDCREDDLEDIHREVAVLAECKSPCITHYYASVLLPGTSQLLIIMELLASSVADLVSHLTLN